jgi:hypothetical protein
LVDALIGSFKSEVIMETATLSKRALFRTQSVLVIATSNPKKPGSMSYDRFENYFKVVEKFGNDGDYSVQDCLEAGVRMDDIQHDSKHGFIVLGDEAIEAHRAALEAKREADIEAARKLLASVDKKAK